MIEHPIQWTAPSPLWLAAANAGGASGRRTLRQPAILRFASDTFMEDFLAMLQSDPMQLSQFVAQPETWRGPTTAATIAKPMPGLRGKLNRLRLAASRSSSTALTSSSGSSTELALGSGATQPALKLYQPAHQRYYLVAACFVCRLAGLPDRVIDSGKQEKATYVVRRLFPPGGPQSDQPVTPCNAESCEEYALVTTASGTGWQKVEGTSGPATLVSGEEQLPLFPSYFIEDDGRRRRLLAGLIPVGKRETYMGAAQLSSDGAIVPPESAGGSSSSKLVDPRMMLLWSQVTEPWKRLSETADRIKKTLQGTGDAAPPSTSASNALTKQTREQLQTISWYILLDFMKLLKQYIPNVWASLMGQPLPSALTTAQSTLITAFTNTTISNSYATNLRTGTSYADAAVARSLSEALKRIMGGVPFNEETAAEIEQNLDSVTEPYLRNSPAAEWPSFLFPLADPVETGPRPPAKTGTVDDPDPLKALSKRIDNLADLFEQALPAPPAANEMPAPAMASQPLLDAREGWFVIRCVFERPLCGALEPPVVSEPSKPFQMAGFFDPDAPARPIRIALPVDTSPAGLRKFDKNTAFMISDVLCGQIDRMKGMTLGDLILSVLPWPLHKDLSVPEGGPCTDEDNPSLQVGMICSLSIPIITICALLLLMIIVALLDIIFKWIPFFLICFPLPGFKAKD